jgi:hypothetical protein
MIFENLCSFLIASRETIYVANFLGSNETLYPKSPALLSSYGHDRYNAASSNRSNRISAFATLTANFLSGPESTKETRLSQA